MFNLLQWFLGILLVWAGLSLAPMVNHMAPHPYYQADGFEVIAHGAGQGLRPKNTLEAAKHAWQLGADVIEMDIHASWDKQLLARHDETVDSTTNGQGRIRDMTWAQLQELDAGFQHLPEQDFPYRGKQVRIPALRDIFKTLPKARYMLEIKPNDRQVSQLLCNLINQYGMQHQVLVTSFHSDALHAFRRGCPSVATAMTKNEITWFVLLEKIGLSHLFPVRGQAVQVPEYWSGVKVLSPSLVAALHQRGVKIQVWTVNDVEKMVQFKAFQVDGLISDFPDRVLALSDEHKK
ncbi:glycerophosphodiester phosphodiesterase [Bowmanella sp. Y26]|uniref:glycerophosphodiester phosphodiesterase n=1 Tax=Bowmanella yangjiangensis TaxID=2811230 RepID=UPI001BDD5C6D|nr:glycerophosphodiester phosphodiesterase [Bowmanella yangjiangensis]MBT1064139.1 glycerophosphodiester phosphodiesterase [Bowmanella yangjiangensis]